MASSLSNQDRYGLPISTGSAIAAERYVEGLDRQLAITAGGDDLLQASIDADPDFALAHAALAYVQAYRRRPAEAKASADRARARALAGGVSRREQQQVAAVGAFVE